MAAPTTLTVSGILLLGIGILVGWYAFPNILNSQIVKQKQLRKGTDARKFWVKLPIALNFKIYVMNVTNYEEVTKGAVPNIQEIGPYCYEEYKEKVDLVDDPERDTITYSNKNTFIFNATASSPLTGDEVVTVPNAALLGLAKLVYAQKPGALGIVNKAIPQLFGNPSTPFVVTTAKEFLFDGILVNCTKGKDFAANTICDQLRKDPKGVVVVDEETFLFSAFGPVNATVDKNTITVKRGMEDVLEVGQVVAYNGKEALDIWGGPYCNQLKGTDTTIFPPFQHKQDIWSFGAEICRSLAAKYVREGDYNGVHGNYYEADLGDMSTIPEEKCFCPTNDTCLKKGAYDITKCIGAPIVVTLPHFHLCHPDYKNGVTGLSESTLMEHGIYSLFEPLTGTPVQGRKRIQFNMFFERITKIKILKEFPEKPILTPLFWVEEGADLNSTYTNIIKKQLYRTISIVHIGRWVFVALGVVMIAGAMFVFYSRSKLLNDGVHNDNKTNNITQVSPAY